MYCRKACCDTSTRPLPAMQHICCQQKRCSILLTDVRRGDTLASFLLATEALWSGPCVNRGGIMCAMQQAHGNWVTGERFWDREEDLARFISQIREGAHILLVAQRRM